MTSTEKNEINSKISKEDAALYRLFAIIGFAIVGFTGLVIVGNNEGKCWDTFSAWWFKALMLALFAACIAAAVLSYLGKIKWKSSVFSIEGIGAFFAPIFFLLAVYTNMASSNSKAKIAFVAIVFIAFICNIYPIGYSIFSASMTLCGMFMYYLSKNKGDFNGKLFDKALKIVSYPMAFILPLALIAVLLIAKRNGGNFKLGKKTIFSVKDKAIFNSMLVILCAAVIFSAAVLIFHAAFVPAIIALGVIYITVGIICTIKIL